MGVKIREVIAADAEAISLLCDQLGYPTTSVAVRQRLEQMQPREHHAVYVAQCHNAGVVGWIHVYLSHLVLADVQAEIGGLVVDENYRGGGIGGRLLQQAEQWARQRECKSVYVRSNIIRQQAHVFYEQMGYSQIKTSLAFHKVLNFRG